MRSAEATIVAPCVAGRAPGRSQAGPHLGGSADVLVGRGVVPAHTGSASDFDFLLGRWRVRNRRLVGRLEGSTRWESFEASSEVEPFLGGRGNIDRFAAPRWRPSFIGQTIRLFDPEVRQWSLYWVDNQRCRLDPPVVGGFDAEGGAVGVFEGKDRLAGAPIDVRFIWRRFADGDGARWEQAFSDDGGASWETNWVMDFEREA